ncbi:hypothetical protein D6779_06645 [Candidatus Parcubacteria bacterium]|nr:MAG: hypothetical protein D6779_06645 [Candidatus Parcubacteria bacterium]
MSSRKKTNFQRFRGEVTWFKGTYGFISYEGKDIFFHISQVENNVYPQIGDLVEFGISRNEQDEDIAVEVTVLANEKSDIEYDSKKPPFLDNSEIYRELRDACDEILDGMIDVVSGFNKIKKTNRRRRRKSAYNLDFLQSLRARAKSELLTIAFFGAFSAGKSFLISGLINRLDWFSHDYHGRTIDRYVPLIPGSPRSTSSCPLAVEPAADDKMTDDMFFVMFDDTGKWEKREPVHHVIIQSYVTELPNALASRKASDRQRNVVKARLIIQNSGIRARLYDLPGTGSVGNKYAEIVYSFVQQSDCMVFVASAEKTMGEEQLELLRYIYEHHKASHKPVFFVLTQIDKHDDFDTASGKLVWQDVLEANNEFLRDYFRISQRRADEGFIADGFIPVSPAYEAKGTKLKEMGDPSGDEYIRSSNMAELRNRLDDYLISTSGPTHLSEIVLEARRALSPLVKDITETISAESLPLADVQNELEAKRAYRNTLIEGQEALRDELINLGKAAVDRAFSRSDPDDLWALLRERLEHKIKTEDVLKEKVIHELEMERAKVIREWINRPSDGPATMWIEAWSSLEDKSRNRVRDLLSKAKAAEARVKNKHIGRDDVAERVSTIPRELMDAQTLKETIDVASKAWPVVAGLGITGVIASLSGSLSVLGPIGWAAIITAGVAGVFANWRKSQIRNKRRQDMLLDLDKLAHHAIKAYKEQANQVISSYVGVLMGVIDDEIQSTNEAITVLERRLQLPENISRSNRLATLRGLLKETEKISNRIEDFEEIFQSAIFHKRKAA